MKSSTLSTFAALTLSLSAAMAFVPQTADAQARLGARATVANPDGGVSGGAVSGFATPSGAAGVRGRAYTSDGQGNAQMQSGGAWRGANGGVAGRTGSAYVNQDGSAGRSGAFAAQGANGGNVQSSGGVTRGSDGSVNGNRSTTAENSAGGTYEGSTDYDKGTGVSHTSTCTTASGEVVPCY